MDLFQLDTIDFESLLSIYRFNIAVLNRLHSMDFSGNHYISTRPYSPKGYWEIISAFPEAINHWNSFLEYLGRAKHYLMTTTVIPEGVEYHKLWHGLDCAMKNAVAQNFESIGSNRKDHWARELSRIQQRREVLEMLGRIHLDELPGDRSTIDGLTSLTDINTEIWHLFMMMDRIVPDMGKLQRLRVVYASLDDIKQDYYHDRPNINRLPPETLRALINTYMFHISVLHILHDPASAKHTNSKRKSGWDIVEEYPDAQESWNDLLCRVLTHNSQPTTKDQADRHSIWKQLDNAKRERYGREFTELGIWAMTYQDWELTQRRMKALDKLLPSHEITEPSEPHDECFVDLLIILWLLGEKFVFERKILVIEKALQAIQNNYGEREKNDLGYRDYKEKKENDRKQFISDNYGEAFP